jgi:hypothetical protein
MAGDGGDSTSAKGWRHFSDLGPVHVALSLGTTFTGIHLWLLSVFL